MIPPLGRSGDIRPDIQDTRMDMNDRISPNRALTKRDTYLDFTRGMMILSVIHIHTVYWSLAAYIPDIVRQLAYLVDIPIFFFISGTLFKNMTVWVTVRTAFRQFLRIYLHYVAITFLAAGGILLWLHFGEHRMEPQVGAVLFSIFRIQPLGRMWGCLSMYCGNLWYIQTYLPLLLLVPLLIGLPFFRKAKWAVLALVTTAWVLISTFLPQQMFWLVPAGQVLFYAIYFVLGAIYRTLEHRCKPKWVALALALNLLVALGIFVSDGNTLVLTSQKFPPTFTYLVYTMLLVHVFVLVRPFWGRVHSRAVAPVVWAGRNSMVLYLIQGAVCSLPFFFADRLGTTNPWALYAMVFSFNVLLTFGLSGLYVAASSRVKAATSRLKR
jgi:peptidoglycan/LPS O-acetylase OafA/YrhL